MTITAQIESLTVAWPELEPHFPEHWRMLGLWRDKMPLDVDKAAYFRIDAEGGFTLGTVREDGRLVAYANFFVRPHLHYRSTVCATMDVIYLEQSLRGSGHGAALGKTVLAELKRRGVGPMFGGSKNHNGIEAFWRAMGMEPVETVLGMWIGD